jgi:hypothetical protein
MHKVIYDKISKFYSENKEKIDSYRVADLGSYDINGSVKSIIKHAVGFDILEGRGVDVVLKPGIIPEEHKNKYNLVISASSFQTCPKPEEYKKEIIDLLETNGLILLTMCGKKCKARHSSSPNKYRYRDCIRMTKEELINFFKPEFELISCMELAEQQNDDIIYCGKKI